jgi:predicted flap endonuclease-1-like 5' DNA nuclease
MVDKGGKNVKGAIVFLAVFVLFLVLALIEIALPPAPWLIQQFISDILQTDYATLTEGIINGVIYGAIVYLIFATIMAISDRTKKPKQIVVKMQPASVVKSTAAVAKSSETVSEPSQRSAKVEEIEGIGRVYASKLNKIGVNTTDELLEAGGTRQGRKELSDKTGISETVLLEWVNMADLFRIKGIGEEYSELLKEAGVNTVIELARRNPANLHETLVGVNDAKNLVRRTPTLNQTKDWIEQAKDLPRKVEH